MKKVEGDCEASMGKEETKRTLMPFTLTLQPILKVLGINLEELKDASISE